jgi:hypothetical protein
MKVFEIFGYKPEAPEGDYDMHDDLMYFMNADPEFYRHTYYPFQHKVYAHCDKDKEVSPKAFKNIVIKAFEEYKKKFPIKELSENLSENDIKEICEKLQSQEINHYHEFKTKRANEKKK